MTKVLIRKPGMRSVRRGVGDTFLPEGGELVPVAAQQSLDVGARRGGGQGQGERARETVIWISYGIWNNMKL